MATKKKNTQDPFYFGPPNQKSNTNDNKKSMENKMAERIPRHKSGYLNNQILVQK